MKGALRLLIGAGVLLLGTGTGGAAARVSIAIPDSGVRSVQAGVGVVFRTPSGNVACALQGESLRCDVLSGVKPLPPKPRTCEFDWGVGMEMTARGRARILCASDAVYSSSARVLLYGRTWRRGGFSCLSRKIGLRCKNLRAHGFFLSRQRSYRF